MEVHFAPDVFSQRHVPNLEQVTISGLNIRTMPPGEFCRLENLKSLNLSRTGFDDLISVGIVQHCDRPVPCRPCLRKLELLDLSGASLNSLDHPLSITVSSKLTQLHFNDNQINHIATNALQNLRDLIHVDLSKNLLQEIPVEIFQEKSNLKVVSIGDNSLSSLPDGLFQGCPNLVKLNIGGNALPNEEFHAAIFAGLKSLKILNISNNIITEIWADTFQPLKQLSTLLLANNRIRNIDASLFWAIPTLETLDLDHNKAVKLVHRLMFRGLNRLQNLQLADCGITDITEGAFADLSSLKHLNISFNNLTSIPLALGDLHFLLTLDMEGNQISTLSPDSLEGLYQLQGLNLKGNRLHQIPADLFSNTPKVAVINLANNLINWLEYGLFRDLSFLNFVRLDGNQLHSLRLLFLYVPNLYGLYLSHNNITSISPNMLPKSLSFVDLSHNSIAKIDDYSFAQLGNLKTVYLQHNKLSVISENALAVSSKLTTKPEVHLAGQILQCSCEMGWIKVASGSTRDNLPVVADRQELQCTTVPEGNLKPLLQVEAAEFLCQFTYHCGSDCMCCDYDACFCEYSCPEGCICFRDYSWDTVNVRCRNLTSVPKPMPSKVTHIFLDENDLINLKKQEFIGLRQLEVLWLNDSFIYDIENRTFAGQEGLKVLRLDNNKLAQIGPETFEGLKNLEYLYLNDNLIEKIELDTFQNLKLLKHLFLNDNKLQTLFHEMFEPHHFMDMMKLSGNPWRCGCDVGPELQTYIVQKNTIVMDANNMMCAEVDVEKRSLHSEGETPASYFTNQLVNHNFEYCFMNYTNATSGIESMIPLFSKLELSLVAILVIVFATTVLCTCIFYCQRESIRLWLFKHFGVRIVNKIKEEPGKIYDAFVSYSNGDEQMMVNNLAPQLEEGRPGYKLYVLYRDTPRHTFPTQRIMDAMGASRRVIILLTQNFLNNEWSSSEFRVVHQQVLKDKTKHVIIIMLDNIPQEKLDPDLRKYVRNSTCLRWGEERLREKLRYALPDKVAHNNNSDAIEVTVIEDTKPGNEKDVVLKSMRPINY